MPSKEEKTVKIPESITINGVTYSVKDTPELQQFIQEVSKVEKAKLYSQFESLKAQIATLGQTEIEKGNKSFDIKELSNELKNVFVTKEDLKEVLPGIIKEVVQPVLTATEQTRENELQQYREKIINENIASCIPDLVKGKTKEELDASLKESIRIRAAYPTPSTVGIDPTKHVTDPLLVQQAAEQNKEAAAPIPTPPAAPRRPSPEMDGKPTGVKSLSMSEFAQKRDSIRQQLESLYGDM